MVDSRKPTMSDFTSLEQRVERIEAAIDTGFAEQRAYTEFAFETLRGDMRGRFDTVDARFTSIDGRFASIDARFDSMDARFDSMDARFNRLERKLDQFIDTQSRANAIAERRLKRLELPATE